MFTQITSNNPGEPWVSKAAIADHYGVSPRTVERWMLDGLHSRLVGGVRRFTFATVETYLDDRARRDQDEAA